MSADDLKEEIRIELESMDIVVNEVTLLLKDLSDKQPTIRDKTAGAAFMAQFYGGIENILKRIHKYNGIAMPHGDSWHIEVFKRFCNPPYRNLPLLFDDVLSFELAPFRKFRHVVYHGYGFQFEWERMKDGLFAVVPVYNKLLLVLNAYLEKLQ